MAAHRQNRPWQGERAVTSEERPPAYVEDCYFCPGNVRVSGARNPDYRAVFVFDLSGDGGRASKLKIVLASIASLFQEIARHLLEEQTLRRPLTVRDRRIVQPIEIRIPRHITDTRRFRDSELHIRVFGCNEPFPAATDLLQNRVSRAPAGSAVLSCCSVASRSRTVAR